MAKPLGIDVSEHNGSLNWDIIKRDGIKFAIIRSSWGHFEEDLQFRRNVKECERVGMPYGLYHYSYVSNDDEMKREASGFIGLCKTCKPLYPCYIDMEDADGWKANLNVSDAMNVKTCDYTCSQLEKAGFYAGIYANLDWLTNHINSRSLDRYDKWVAQWADKITYKLPFGMWQFTSDGKLSGVNGRMDFNYAYVDYPTLIKENGLNGSKDENKPTPPKPTPPKTKYQVGDVVSYSGLWTQSNGGAWYPAANLLVKKGKITKVLAGAQHPYLIDHNVGWANDEVIKAGQASGGNKYTVGSKVTYTGLWTQSNGGTWYPKSQLAIKQGVITQVIAKAEHPYLVGNGIGWANDKVIDDEPSMPK